MRKETRTMQNMRRMCGNLALCPETILLRSSLVMKIYRDVVWMASQRAEIMREEAEAITQGRDLGAALAYLSDLAPDERRQDFEMKVSGLFETKWMVDLIDTAMLHVRDYPCQGELYYEILFKSFMTRFTYSESELLETFSLERSSFYDRKREATLLLGIALWGYAIPEFKESFGREKFFDGDYGIYDPEDIALSSAFSA